MKRTKEVKLNENRKYKEKTMKWNPKEEKGKMKTKTTNVKESERKDLEN